MWPLGFGILSQSVEHRPDSPAEIGWFDDRDCVQQLNYGVPSRAAVHCGVIGCSGPQLVPFLSEPGGVVNCLTKTHGADTSLTCILLAVVCWGVNGFAQSVRSSLQCGGDFGGGYRVEEGLRHVGGRPVVAEDESDERLGLRALEWQGTHAGGDAEGA